MYNLNISIKKLFVRLFVRSGFIRFLFGLFVFFLVSKKPEMLTICQFRLCRNFRSDNFQSLFRAKIYES